MASLDEQNSGFQMPVEESAMRAYLQRYPFAMGPDKAMNARCAAAVREHFALRAAAAGPGVLAGEAAVVRFLPEETVLAAEVLARLHDLMARAGVVENRRADMIDDFGWEAKMIPAQSKDVLIIGCGEGFELLFLRAVLPEAKMTAVDYTDTMSPELKAAVGVRFFCGDMNGILDGFGGVETFDLVSSNHTLEHLYTPDAMLATLSGLLRPEGALISTLPMDAVAGSPFLDKVTAIARQGEIHPVDLVYLDAGHPWKTNPADLQRTFLGAGFGRVELYQRAEHLSRSITATEEKFHARKEKGLRLHGKTFGLIRGLIKALFRRRPPALLVRVLLAAEQKAWFGANRLKNLYTQEVCVVARKQA